MEHLRSALAVIGGWVVGSVVNMSLIISSSSIIPPPPGCDVTTMEGLVAAIPKFQPKHFVMPFAAHALGTLAGAAFAAFVIVRGGGNINPFSYAYGIGVLFLFGGLINLYLLPHPAWFAVVDVLGAYLPMAHIGAKLIVSYFGEVAKKKSN